MFERIHNTKEQIFYERAEKHKAIKADDLIIQKGAFPR